MKQVTLEIELTVKAPFISKSSDIEGFGLDATMAKNADGGYIFPRKHIKGLLREAWTDLHSIAPNFKPKIEEWLGEKSEYKQGASSSVEPNRGLLVFKDFVLQTDKERAERLFRISIDKDRGAVEQGAYQVVEALFPARAEPMFKGEISYFAADDAAAKNIADFIERGLQWITHLGALENVGFGELIKVKVNDPEIITIMQQNVRVTPEAFDIVIRPDAPFCLSKRRTSENIFESETVISGGAIKGALAETWLKSLGKPLGKIDTDTDGARRALGEHFDKLRFTFAFPALAGTNARPTAYPFSLVVADKNFYDLARCETPVLIRKDGKLLAPTFFMDWKPDLFGEILSEYGWASPKTKLDVFTAIENNRAKDEQLYAYEMIAPKDEDKNEIEWLGRVDLNEIVDETERETVAEQLAGLLETLGLQGFGKTKAKAVVKVHDKTTIKNQFDSDSNPIDDCWIVTLQTPALLCDAARLDETSGKAEQDALYKEVWSEISRDESESEASLELVRYFHGQQLAGGDFLHKRFQFDKPYNPYLLTAEGSVFVLKAVAGRETEARKKIEKWLKTGLPLPQWTKKRFERDNRPGDAWENCPFVPQNGYGEVAVNLPAHKELNVPGGKYQSSLYESIEVLESSQTARLNDEPANVAAKPPGGKTPAVQNTSRKFVRRWRVEGTLTTQTPLRIGDGGTTSREKLKNKQTGNPVEISSVATDKGKRAYLPATTIKAKLRQWAQDCGANHIKVLFGSEKSADKNNLAAGRAQFQNAYALDPALADGQQPPYWDETRATGVATGIAVNRHRRTAREQKLFHYEFVPPNVGFKLIVTGNDYDGDAPLLELLALLEGFKSGNVKLGSDTSDAGNKSWGRFDWYLNSVKVLDKAEIDNWLNQKAQNSNSQLVGCEITSQFGKDWEKTGEIDKCVKSSQKEEPLIIELSLQVRDNFLVNDPSRAKTDEEKRRELKTGKKSDKKHHTPLGRLDDAPPLPRSSIKGAARSQAERILRTIAAQQNIPEDLIAEKIACYPDDPAKSCEAINEFDEARNLCLACQLFGAGGWRAPFQAAPFTAAVKEIKPQEFVAIDRFTGGVAGGAKFDAESFYRPKLEGSFSVDLEKLALIGAEQWARGLLALTLRDLVEGDVRIGFGRAKGYGAVTASFANISYSSPADLIQVLKITAVEFKKSIEALTDKIGKTVNPNTNQTEDKK